MKSDTVSEVLSREDNASTVTAALQPRPMVRERNASIAFYAMLSQGTAGMLEREMNHLKVYDTSKPAPSPSPLSSSSPLSRKMSSGGSCIVFKGHTAEPWNTEIVLSSASESDSQPLELSTPDTSDRDEREGSLIIGGSGSGVHESLSSALGIAAGGHSKGRPKSLQPWSSGELDVAGGSSASSLRDRSNSATTEQQKQHDDEQNRRRLGQLKKKRNAKNNSEGGQCVHQAHHARGRHKNERTGSFDDATLRASGGHDSDGDDGDDDDIDVIRERPAQVEESSDDDQRAALTGSRGGSNGGGAKRVKSLKHLKERILSFRGKVDLGSSSGGSGDGSSPHHQHQRSNSTGTTSLPSPTPQSTVRDQSSSTTRTSSTTMPSPPAAAGGSDAAPTPTESDSDTALPNNNTNTSTNNTSQIAAATTKEQTKTMRKKKRKKQGRKAKAPAAAQGTTSGSKQATATSSPPAQEMPLVANRPAVVTRDRQGSVAFYAALGQGASVLLADSVYKPSTST
jgi:hypothetical protein